MRVPMPDEPALFAAMRASPDDAGPRLVYADWLLGQGDARGELIVLDERDRSGARLSLPQLDRYLELASEHGFPTLPDDPCARILPFSGGGSYPAQYWYDRDGREYYLRWRYGFSIDIDHETVWEGDLDVTTTNEFTFRELNVVLAIVSEAILDDRPLAALRFPDRAGIESHPQYRVGRSPMFGCPDKRFASRKLELRDFARWQALYARRQRMAGQARPGGLPRPLCRCGIDGLSCAVAGCEVER